jgi:hypothetical protein
MSVKNTINLVAAESILEECLEAFNMMPNQQFGKGSRKDTYSLASKIEKYFKGLNDGKISK